MKNNSITKAPLRSAVFILVLTVSVIARAEKQYIWPEGAMPDPQPHQIAAMTDVSGKEGFVADEWRKPYLDWFEKPQAPNGACAVLISGGSYNKCCDVGLIKEWRAEMAKLGFQCVNFVYRTPRAKGLEFYRTAWEDGQRAIRVVRSEAAARGFDPNKICTVSMSAGSHLATLLATSSLTPAYGKVDALDDLPANINLAIVFAPAFVLTDGLGTPNSRMGQTPDVRLDDCFKFDEATPPMCLLHGGNDRYSPNGSTMIYRELRKRKIPAEIHLFSNKPHGAFGFERAVEFMRQLGWLGELGKAVALMERFVSDDARAIYEKRDVWPEGKIPGFEEHQSIPYIEWHIPSNLTTKAIQIVWSGGAYNGSKPDEFEVAPVRRFLNDKGMAVVTLNYRHPRPKLVAKHVTAWQDAQRAIRIVRSEAAARDLDPKRIGIMGSSAGGHLALLCATSSRVDSYLPVDDIDKVSCEVQWAIPVYPAYSLTDGLDNCNKHGGNELGDILAPEFVFDPKTPPMLFLHGDGDGWAAMNSVRAWEKLRRMGIQSDLHTLVKRDHCFQREAAPSTASWNWMDRIWDFLVHQRVVKQD